MPALDGAGQQGGQGEGADLGQRLGRDDGSYKGGAARAEGGSGARRHDGQHFPNGRSRPDRCDRGGTAAASPLRSVANPGVRGLCLDLLRGAPCRPGHPG